MTIASSLAEPFGGHLPSDDDRFAAKQLRKILASKMGDSSVSLPIIGDDRSRQEVILSPALAQLLFDVLRHISKGEAVTLVPVAQMMTTQQAADILNVSRPYLIGVLNKGDIPYTKVGRHRRIKADDIFAYKAKRDKTRSEALSLLFEESAELI